MAVVLAVVSLVLMSFVYVWYLQLAARWTLKTSLNRKVCWLFVGLVLALTLLNLAISAPLGRAASFSVGLVAHLLLGSWFFGRFAVNSGRVAPGFTGGLKMTAVALALLGGTSLILIALPTYILSTRA